MSPLQICKDIVMFVVAEDNIPDGGCGEEHLVVWTYEIVLLVNVTYIRNIIEYPVFHSDFNEGRHDSPNSLH